MPRAASAELLNRFAAALTELGAQHGVTNLRHARPGTLIANVEDGRTDLDLARFEMCGTIKNC